VLVSGFLEQSLRNATAQYAKKRSQPVISNYVIKATNRVTNLTTEKLKEYLLAFDGSWQAQLDTLLADETKDAINSIVALRHSVAHGQPADVTFERVYHYYARVKQVVVALEQMMGIDS